MERAFDTPWAPHEEDLWDDVPDAYWDFLGCPSETNPPECGPFCERTCGGICY